MSSATSQFIGNLVEDPNLRVFADGTCLTTFRLACTRRRFDRAQERWVDGNTVFMKVSCWRQLAENVSASLRRGDRAVVVGQLRQSSYDARDGSRRVSLELDADAIGAELTWQSVHVRRNNRSGVDGAGSRGAGMAPPGAAAAGGPSVDGVGGGYPVGYAPPPPALAPAPAPAPAPAVDPTSEGHFPDEGFRGEGFPGEGYDDGLPPDLADPAFPEPELEPATSP